MSRADQRQHEYQACPPWVSFALKLISMGWLPAATLQSYMKYLAVELSAVAITWMPPLTCGEQ
jgi:hypothetical protein